MNSNFQETYEKLSDGELLRIASEREELFEEANAALTAELAKRGLPAKKAGQFKRNLDRITARDTVGNVSISLRGYGKQFLGASNYLAQPKNSTEEFDSTLWFFCFWLPFLPLATVRIRRKLLGKSIFW